MDKRSLLFLDPPALPDETATQMLDFLYNLTAAFEEQYMEQVIRCYQMRENHEELESDLFEIPGDDIIPY